MRRGLAAVAAAGLLGLATGGCAADAGAGDPDDPAGVRVVAALYPLEFVADRVAGGHASVTGLTPPGAEPHDLELSPSQVADLAGADVVAYLAGLQPAVDEAVAAHAGRAGFDVTTVVPLLDASGAAIPLGGAAPGTADPHVWLDPDRLASIAAALATLLAGVDPDRAEDYTTNALALDSELAALEADLAAGLADCQRREVVVSHAAFGYLTDRHELRQIAVSGLEPEAEPTPGQLAEVINQARSSGATTVFFDVLGGPAIAETIAGEVGATTAALDPLEGRPAGGGDYFSAMRANLAALRAGLECR
jgi:zinc transport system substrate-binding protein